MKDWYEIEREKSNKDRKLAGLISVSALLIILAILHFLGYSIPTPPLPEQLLYKDMKMELIPLDPVVYDEGTGGGGSGTPMKTEKAETTPPQMEQMVTQKSSTTHVKSGNSNTTNTNQVNNNPPSGQNTSDNPFGTGGSGGGDGHGNGNGFGDDNGNGSGPGNGNGSGGAVRRYLVEQPNTSNIKSDENCTIVLSVLVDADGNIVGQPIFAKGASTTNNTVLINQVIAIVKREARFNKAPGAKNLKQAITIRLIAN
ncbi:MAG TPA: hypothetical protein PLI97_07020 [Fluviicola sp.]|nr:hypothetical protein [Fluviicola sp.]